MYIMYMEGLFLNDFVFVLPELYLVFIFLSVLPLGVYFESRVYSVGNLLGYQMSLVILGMLFFLGLIYFNICEVEVTLFLDAFDKGSHRYFFLFLMLVSTFVLIFLGQQQQLRGSLHEFEFFILTLFVVFGSICLIFCNDFLSFYLGLEMQGLALYVMASMKINSTYSTEAGLKYFVLGAFASSLIIFGLSLLYGFTGISNFGDLSLLFANINVSTEVIRLGCYTSLLFFFGGLIFKVGGFPFHVWVPDVYEGIPSQVLSIFSVIPKISIICVFWSLLKVNLLFSNTLVVDLLFYSGVCSIIIGSIGALQQSSLKRLLAYSAIAHSGFMLYGLSVYSLDGFLSVLFYICVYAFLLLGLFSVVLSTITRYNSRSLQYISNFGYIYKSQPIVAIILCLTVFGMAGIPPLSGFFSKLLIFLAAIKESYIFSSIICIFASVIGTSYYLRVIRSIMFTKNNRSWLFFFDVSRLNAYAIYIFFLLNIFFVAWGELLLGLVFNISL